MSPRWKPLPSGPPEPRSVGEGLDRLTKSLGIEPTLLTRWSELVGEGLAEHTRPRGLREGTLVVAVDDPVWATQLRWLEGDLVTRVAELLGPGTVQRIEVRVRGAVTPDW